MKRRPRSDGSVAYRVVWRLGGGREGRWESETFDAAKTAYDFKRLVEDAGGAWPDGWIKGQGFTSRPMNEHPSFATFAERYLDTLHNVQPDTLSRYRRQVRVMAPCFTDIASLDEDAVARLVRNMSAAGKKAKTISNYHGLLSAICNFAVRRGLLASNPCQYTKLPKRDSYDGEQVGCYLEPSEVDLILANLPANEADLVRFAVGTGLRWGELSALQRRDFALVASPPTVTVNRAWKEDAYGRPILGAPKTARSRRTLTITSDLAAMVARRVDGKEPDDFVFTAPLGGPLRQPTFYEDRWQPAVASARRAGLQKKPRFHDLRHTHTSWLIAAGVPLPVISARLGHRSIEITVNRYGHLMADSHQAVDTAIERALGGISSTATV